MECFMMVKHQQIISFPYWNILVPVLHLFTDHNVKIEFYESYER